MKEFAGVFMSMTLAFFVLVGTPALYAEEDLIDAQSQLDEKASEASANGRIFKETLPQDDEIDSDPSAFEGDSDSMTGERAPENLPMSDSPVAEGIAVD